LFLFLMLNFQFLLLEIEHFFVCLNQDLQDLGIIGFVIN